MEKHWKSSKSLETAIKLTITNSLGLGDDKQLPVIKNVLHYYYYNTTYLHVY